VERYNEIMDFFKKKTEKKKRKGIKVETWNVDQASRDEIVNMLWIEMAETEEPLTNKMYQRVVKRWQRFETSKGLSYSVSVDRGDDCCSSWTIGEMSTENIYDAPNAHLVSHEPHSEDEIIDIIDRGRKLLKAKKIGEWVKKQGGNKII